MADENSNSERRRYFREPAKRVLASELRETRLQFKGGEDEYSPTYIMLPTGERCNRIFFCGILTNKERRGEDNNFIIARVRDPTGLFFINASSYNENAMHELSSVENDAYVAVVGKPAIRQTPDGAVMVNIRVETIAEVDEETCRTWLDDTTKATLDRIELFGETEDSEKASEFYNTDLSVYRKIVYDALAGQKL
ncbi:nucleic acid-binding protein [Methanoplanus endosymbiosus]|uniref:Nucleic acid-binding protein n=1 Tax=Methanoplanus endosymbiosus TaxID=33865 RepID=A0A9E7PM71_9EURY|nr:nucleic acid-binding protein [Methanoplanus endosymbiosus]UUX91206.1 nucleic acid-binding protein [Methanoplanus endosymbiosus]